MTRQSHHQRDDHETISLHSLTPEQALGAALNTPLPKDVIEVEHGETGGASDDTMAVSQERGENR